MSLPQGTPALDHVRQAVAQHRYAHHLSALSTASLVDQRTLPVPPAFAQALRAAGLPGGLVRGRTYGCGGVAPVSCLVALLRHASAAGSWVAWCAATSPNWRAAADAGWALQRVVVAKPDAHNWSSCIDVFAGEIDVVVVDLPMGVPSHQVRRVMNHVAHRNGVLVVLMPPHTTHTSVVPDVVFRVDHARYGTQCTHLTEQTLEVVLGGRRVPASKSFSVVMSSE
jgi:hypothetical protein